MQTTKKLFILLHFYFLFCCITSKSFIHQNNKNKNEKTNLRYRRKLNNEHYCPASTNKNHFQAGLLGYPVDFITPSTPTLSPSTSSNSNSDSNSNNYNSFKLKNLPLKNCSFHTNNIYHMNATCYYPNTYLKNNFNDHEERLSCHIKKENIAKAISPLNWTHSFKRVCRLFDESLQFNNSEINIYFFGGSMTFGQSTDGCCCDSNFDSSCPKNSCMEHFQEEEGDLHRSYCSWVRYFGRWIQSEFPNLKINILSRASRGEGSATLAEYLLSIYPPNTEKSFKSTDIVFLDYSVNDCSGGSGIKVGHASESLLRRFFHYGENMPIVILLESFGIRISGRYTTFDPPGYGAPQDYTTYYRENAKYYNITLWSYASSIYTNYTKSLTGFSYIRFSDSHPSWFVHLNLADTYASVFKNEYHKYCVKERAERVIELKEELNKMKQKHQISEQVHLPPIYQGQFECPSDQIYYSDAKNEYNRFTTVPFNPTISSNELEWEVLDAKTSKVLYTYATSPNKISQLNLSTSSSSSNHEYYEGGYWKLYEDRHSKPGWIILPNDNKESILRFSLRNINLTSPLIAIGYLRTYENAGSVKFSVCTTEYHFVLHALWPDHEHHRVSAPDFFYTELDTEKCNQLSPENRWISFNGPYSANPLDKFKLTFLKIC